MKQEFKGACYACEPVAELNARLVEKIKELEEEINRITGLSKNNYLRAEEINRIRTEEIKELEKENRRLRADIKL